MQSPMRAGGGCGDVVGSLGDKAQEGTRVLGIVRIHADLLLGLAPKQKRHDGIEHSTDDGAQGSHNQQDSYGQLCVGGGGIMGPEV